MTISALDLATELIAKPSVTPEDAGCQELIASLLQDLGFETRALPFGPVSNLWARIGSERPLFVYAGHTDVVPTGPLEAWHSPPFSPEVRDGYLYGRGAADMKGGIASMLAATHAFLRAGEIYGSLGFLITSDEEGDAVDGTGPAMDWLAAEHQLPDFCLVGEPSSRNELGDILRHGRRGSMNGRLRLEGVQGHVAYPDSAKNPIAMAGRIIAALNKQVWDQPSEDFPATNLEFSNISAGTGAMNVIPGVLSADFNFRFSPASTPESLRERVTTLIAAECEQFEIDWSTSALPFLTEDHAFKSRIAQAVCEVTGREPGFDTGGGTSDARFIAAHGCPVVELGPCNATIHKVNECVSVADLDKLTTIYVRVLETFLR